MEMAGTINPSSGLSCPGDHRRMGRMGQGLLSRWSMPAMGVTVAERKSPIARMPGQVAQFQKGAYAANLFWKSHGNSLEAEAGGRNSSSQRPEAQ